MKNLRECFSFKMNKIDIMVYYLGKFMNFIENIVENQSSTIKEYEEDYEKSIDNPDAFWKEKAESLSWIKNFLKLKKVLLTIR